jgi:SAM-dependent methyltransferase
VEGRAPDTYDQGYFEWQRGGADESARAMLPVVLDLVSPSSVLDVGCGTGVWLRTASDLGVTDIFGVDGGAGPLVIPEESFRRVDLEQPLDLGRRFDLVICMEVAEHLEPSRAESLVRDLCRAADVVLFSAAIPGQGKPGTGEHVNEQWQSYWANLFVAAGYRTVDAIRPLIWNDDRIAFWYRENAFIALSPTSPLALEGSSTIDDVVHPGLWQFVHAELWASEASPRTLVRSLPAALRRSARRRLARRA